MRPKKSASSPSADLFRIRLVNLLDQCHELYRLAAMIDWERFNTVFGDLYCADNGYPAKLTRLMAGLH